jgi:hypothetical protein
MGKIKQFSPEEELLESYEDLTIEEQELSDVGDTGPVPEQGLLGDII